MTQYEMKPMARQDQTLSVSSAFLLGDLFLLSTQRLVFLQTLPTEGIA